MIQFNLNLQVVLIPGRIDFLRKVQNPTYFWVPIGWDLDSEMKNNGVCCAQVKQKKLSEFFFSKR